jgi:hypothetical protein
VQAQDPSLQVTLPGEVAPAMAPGIFGADEVFGPGNDLRVARGGTELLAANADKVREEERRVLARMLDPLMGSAYAGAYAPALEAGRSAAGQGMTGASAAEMARDQANKEANRHVQEQLASGRLEQTRTAQQESSDYKLHDRVEKLGDSVVKNMGIPGLVKDEILVDELLQKIGSGQPFLENRALAGEIMRYSGKASSDREARKVEGDAGKWNQFNGLLNRWVGGGALPADFKDQLSQGLRMVKSTIREKRHQAGLMARDAAYGAFALGMTLDEKVAAGAELYHKATGRVMTPEQLAQEKQRLLRLSGANPTDLGVTSGPVPKVNEVLGKPAPQSAEDKEADDLLRLLEQQNAQP